MIDSFDQKRIFVDADVSDAFWSFAAYQGRGRDHTRLFSDTQPDFSFGHSFSG